MPSSKGTKMSLGEFVGPSAGAGALPTAPRARGPDDDGSFQRYPKRGEREPRDPTRSDKDSSWRRGGGGEPEGNRGGNWKGGEGGFRSSDRGSRNDERGGGDRGGSWRGGGDRHRDDRDGRSWRGGEGAAPRASGTDSAPSSGERPRLQLKQKVAPRDNHPEDNDAAVAKMEKLSIQDSEEKNTSNNEATPASTSKPKREPEVVNSRAAGLSGGDSSARRENNRERGPPPIRNKRFEQMAGEEREKRATVGDRGGRDDDRGPPPVANSRFAAAAEADRSNRDDRGPPPVVNSRFAAAAEADRSNRDDRGPPPVANSRFAAAAEADRSNRDDFRRDDRGPPPVVNSRFAAAAESDRSNRDDFRRDNRGPPPVVNSRFAAAAAMAEQENTERDQRRMDYHDERRGGASRFDRGGPPPQQTSRFAAAALADADHVDREERDRRQTERRNERFEGGPREDRGFGGGPRADRGYGPREDRRFGGPREDRGHGATPEEEMDYFEKKKEKSKVAELLKPKAPPLEDNILKVPVKSAPQHEENMLKIPTKDTGKEKDTVPPPKQKTKETVAPPVASTKHSDEALKEFISGKKQGDELKSWCEEQGASLPPLKRLVFELLTEKEKLNPDGNCAWAEPSQFGAAFLSMIDEDLYGQMQILWGIQQYCDSLGFPKLNDEYVIQAMFRSMYKYDLASDDAFLAWKEDESEEHEKGKMTAIIQTVDWFNWLEEEDQEEEEYEDEEEYEEE